MSSRYDIDKTLFMCYNNYAFEVLSKRRAKNMANKTASDKNKPARVFANRYVKGDIEPVCYDERGNSYEGFVFLATRSRKTIVRGHVEEYLQNCIKRYNQANPSCPIRKFEPHVCRHTFATNMQGLPPKTLQSILGHGNITTTMNHYVDARPSGQQLAEINAIADALT